MAIILFDLDGTLVHTAPDLLAVTNAILHEEGMRAVPDEAIGHLVGHGGRAMLGRAFIERGVDVAPDRLDRLVTRFIDLYAQMIPGASLPFPGVAETLGTLTDEGHVCAVCTNKYEALSRALLDALDLSRWFTLVAGPDTFGVRKPDPAHIARTIEAAGGTLEAALMVGDSFNDIEAARRASVPSVAVTFGYTDTPARQLGADRVVESFAAITPALVAELLPSRA